MGRLVLSRLWISQHAWRRSQELSESIVWPVQAGSLSPDLDTIHPPVKGSGPLWAMMLLHRCSLSCKRGLPVQAEALGNVFRTVMYPRYGPAGGGLLRLHSTYR